MSVQEWVDRSRSITDHLLQWIHASCSTAHPALRIHCYLARRDSREVETRPLIQALLNRGHIVGLPSVNPSDRSMRTLRIRDLAHLEPGPYGIPHPTGSEEIPADSLDLIVMPSVLLDVSGNRIGYGGGYYDRFLPLTRATTIAPCFGSLLVEPSLPTDPTDRPVQWLATESGVTRAALP